MATFDIHPDDDPVEKLLRAALAKDRENAEIIRAEKANARAKLKALVKTPPATPKDQAEAIALLAARIDELLGD